MKNIYLKIIAAVISLGLFYFVDKLIFSDIYSLQFFGIFVVLPIILFREKIFKAWIIGYLLYVISNIYIKFVPPTSSNSCWSFCGGESRDETFFMVYFGLLFILGLLQLRVFVQRKIVEKELKSQIK